MELRQDLQLQTMIKAMTEVVLPAVDPNNELACEQGKLVLGMMHLMAATLPWQHQYDVDELARALNLSHTLIELGNGGEVTQTALNALTDLAGRCELLLEAAKVAPAELEHAVLELRTQTAQLLDAIGSDGEPACRKGINRAVLEASQEQIARERAWFAPQGWDTAEEAPPPLETLLGKLRSAN